MSHKNCHMEKGNEIELCRFQGRPITMEELGNLSDRDFFVDYNKQLYGNTKFDDLPIAIAWIRWRFNQKEAAIMVGYASVDKDGNEIGGMAISYRLVRFNTKDPLTLVEALIKTGHVTRENVTGCLKEPLYRKGRLSMAAKWWGKAICKSAVKKHGGKIAAAAWLRITTRELNTWLNC